MLRLVPLVFFRIFRIIAEGQDGVGRTREEEKSNPRLREYEESESAGYGFLAALVRAHRCETDKEGEEDAGWKRRSRRRRRRWWREGGEKVTTGV